MLSTSASDAYPVDLRFFEFCWDQVLFDRVGVDPVVDLCEVAPDVPAELFMLLLLEPLEFLDEVEFEFYGDPRGELERDILVSECAAIPSRF